MADLSDVELAICGLIVPAVYPNGTGQPPAISSPMVKVYPGWPMSAKLDDDVRANKVNISVFASKVEKNVTKYLPDWKEVSRAQATITATIAGNVATLAGTISVPQNVALTVMDKTYVYAVQANDTLTSIAAALANMISANTPASSSGAAITANGITLATVGVNGTIAREVRRTQKQFMVSIWAPSNDLRVATARLIDPAISAVEWLTFPDGSFGQITYVRSDDNDNPEDALIYRRDIVFQVEYPTLQFATATEVVAGAGSLSGSQFGPSPAATVNLNVGG